MINPTRNGKIARLPQAIRKQLNQRLDEGESGKNLVVWLNGLPEVKGAMETHFRGTAIRQQNISEWRKGGYQDWLKREEVIEVARRLGEDAREMKERGEKEQQPPMSDALSYWLMGRYTFATREVEASEGAEGWRLLRQMCADVARLRRMDQYDRKLEVDARRAGAQCDLVEIERERLAMEKAAQAKTGAKAKKPAPRGDGSGNDPEKPWEEWSEDERIAWARRPENMDRIQALSDEEQIERLKRLFGPNPNTLRKNHENSDPTH